MTRKKKAGLLDAAPVAVVAAPVISGAGHVEGPAIGITAPVLRLPSWLDTMIVTRPFTIADCGELKAMLKREVAGIIDVYFSDTHVHVRVFADQNTLHPTLSRDLVLV